MSFNWKRAGLGFIAVLLSAFAGACVGILFGVPAAQGQMLAGGAIVAMYLMIGAATAMGITGILLRKRDERRIVHLIVFWLLASLVLGFWVRQNTEARKRKKAEQEEKVGERRLPDERKILMGSLAGEESELESESLHLSRVQFPFGAEGSNSESLHPSIAQFPFGAEGSNSEPLQDSLIGFGLVAVPFGRQGVRLLWYADINYDRPPVDSLVFEGENLVYAPPYLQPFYQKTDYGIFYLRLLAVGRHRVKVALNETLDRVGWVDREAVGISYWPDFLATVFAVKPLDDDRNPPRVRPFVYSDAVRFGGDEILQPVAVQGDWIEVRITIVGDSEYRTTAWLRWREKGRLLVSWDYLS